MAKKVLTLIKLQAPGGAGHPGAAGRPGAGSARHQHHGVLQGVQRPDAAATSGTIIPVVITVYEDRSFTFITKTPPAAVLIKQAINLDKGSGEPHLEKVGTITEAQLREIAEKKLHDLNANDVDAAVKIIAGTARSMGVEVV